MSAESEREALIENVRSQSEFLLTLCLWKELLKAGCARAHVVTYSQHPTAFGSSVYGMSCPYLDWQFRKHLENEWRGRGVAVFVNDHLLSLRYSEPVDFRRAFWSIVIHEAAHAAENDPVVPANVPPDELRAAGLEYALATNEYEPPREKGRPPFWGHGECFIRISLHLAQRARRGGYAVDDDDVVDHFQYGLSPMPEYALALGDERERFRRVPASALTYVPAPESFTELFNKDCARWFEDRLNQSDTRK